VARPQQAKVTVIESRQLGLLQPLYHGQDSGIDESDV
jgi:hypothetical protein